MARPRRATRENPARPYGASPSVVLIAGPNSAGKSTVAPTLLQGALAMTEFVNADVIARGLSGFEPESVSLAAERVMLSRLKDLARSRADFAFETTLASRRFAPWISRLVGVGYAFHLICLWLPSPEMAIERVAARVAPKGHHVPDDVIRRRYEAGLVNLFTLYRSLAASWQVFDNSGSPGPRLIAAGTGGTPMTITDLSIWNRISSGGGVRS